MLDIEEFAIDAWCTPQAVKWNRWAKRGILYRGYEKVASAEYFRADEVKRKERTAPREYVGRGVTYGT
jgi:hypothetical protein